MTTTATEPTMPTEQSALLRAILTHPEDDAARLVYADWLQENGQGERAEFIRVQVELAHLRHDNDEETHRINRLRRRERTLFRASQGQWLPDLPGCTALHCPEDGEPDSCSWVSDEDTGPRGYRSVLYPVFRRGFVDSVRLPAADWLRHADALVWHPKQTVECPVCRGFGAHPYQSPWALQGKEPLEECPAKCDKGRISRRIPATAQPITRVVLTTMPEYDEFGSRPAVGLNEYLYALGLAAPPDNDPYVVWCPRSTPEADILRDLLRLRWPGIEFALPGHAYTDLWAGRR